MLQYLIDVSIAWLAFLLLYELVLRRESFHQYNRIYLVVSLCLGLWLPSLTFTHGADTKFRHMLPEPVAKAYQMKKAAHIASSPVVPATSLYTHSNIDTQTIYWIIYLSVALFAIVVLAREGVRLNQLYRTGRKILDNDQMIVETGRPHSPFSFFNVIFVTSRAGYDDAAWTMVVRHERAHVTRLHSVDNLLLLLFRIVFWFHPLVHIYYKRLRLVHEFQADEVAGNNAADYGIFLLEQNMLNMSPMLTHSINYSPIKYRIAMLTKIKSARTKLFKFLLVVPVLAGLVLFCTQSSISGEMDRKANKITFKGNVIEFGPLKVIPFEYREQLQQKQSMFIYESLPDSVVVDDWKTGLPKMVYVAADTMPVAINGRPIFGDEPRYTLATKQAQYSVPVFQGNAASFDEYLFNILQKDLDKLDDGEYFYNINKMVVSDNGSIAYYEYSGFDTYHDPYNAYPIISRDLRQIIDKKIQDALTGDAKFKPAMMYDKPINVRLNTTNYEILVKGHKAKLAARGGC